jgi:anti-anti-sigma factor
MTITVFTFEVVENTLVVVAHGDLFQHRFEDIRNGYNEVFLRLSGDGIDNLLVDFEHVQHFGSAFIGMLVKLSQKARRGGGETMLCGLKPSMIEVLNSLMVLENVKTDFFMVPYPDRESALNSLHQK